jgi:hypothetical protein
MTKHSKENPTAKVVCEIVPLTKNAGNPIKKKPGINVCLLILFIEFTPAYTSDVIGPGVRILPPRIILNNKIVIAINSKDFRRLVKFLFSPFSMLEYKISPNRVEKKVTPIQGIKGI